RAADVACRRGRCACRKSIGGVRMRLWCAHVASLGQRGAPAQAQCGQPRRSSRLCISCVRIVRSWMCKPVGHWGCKEFLQGSQLTMQSLLRGAIAFAELLSCGFATIGVRATLVAIAAQIVDDAVLAHGGRRPSAAEV